MKKYWKKILAAGGFLLAACLILCFLLGGEETVSQEVSSSPIPTQTAEMRIPAEETPAPTLEEHAEKTVPPMTEQPQKETPAPTEAPAEQSEKPMPTASPHPSVSSETEELFCTVSVRCDTALSYDDLDAETRAILPQNGVILAEEKCLMTEGESAFDVLKRVTREHAIHLEFVMTPVYGSAYIEGIANLYELDCGPLSGWMYRVNGVYPGYGASRYQMQSGDRLEWLYTCNLGKDIGGYFEDGGSQRDA